MNGYYRCAVLLLLMMVTLTAGAQFDEIIRFMTDSALQEQVKANRVRVITETMRNDSGDITNANYYYDEQGRLEEISQRLGGGFHRVKYGYDKNGRLSREVKYSRQDTSTIESVYSFKRDAENRLISSDILVNDEGKLVPRRNYETISVKKIKGSTHTISHTFDSYNKHDRTICAHDSVSGGFRFYITYDFHPAMDAKSRRNGKKTLIRYYTKDNCNYIDEIRYKVFGKAETANEFRTSYTKTDSKGRTIEKGNIKYEDEYVWFMQDHPEEFTPNYYAPVFVQAILDGKVQGKRKLQLKQEFSETGLLINKEEYGNVYEYHYNDKGQMTEQKSSSKSGNVSTRLLWYNEKGLVIRAKNTYRSNKSGKPDATTEFIYDYRYY